MARPLPSRPNLDQLKNQAKDLVKGHKSGDPETLRRIREAHPRWSRVSDSDLIAARFMLSSAQLVIAREYGFASWPALKAHVDSLALEELDPVESIKRAFANDDAEGVRTLLRRYPELKAKVNEPVGPFDTPAVVNARSRQMIDVLLEAGADLNAKSRWWAGGFGLLHCAAPELAAYAIERGAVVDAHAAARLGLLGRLKELVSNNPQQVHARGGDGQTSLHFASTVEIAEYLLDHGAEIDARDVDHESTPAQYMTGDRQDVARYLVRRGCKTDLLMATALGDFNLVRKHLDDDPGCIRMRVSNEFFPMVNRHAGGTIYQWTLGFYMTAHQVARKFGHDEILQLLMERSPADVKILAACWLGDEAIFKSLLRAEPDLASHLTDADRRQIAHAARNNDIKAVRLMLEAGLPTNAQGQHGATPLHWAAFHGNTAMVDDLLRFDPPLEVVDKDFAGTPLNWAIHGSEHGWHRESGDYPGTVDRLIKAGAQYTGAVKGSEAVRQVLRQHGVKEQGT
jgi:ankyrin repeat protein